MSMLAERRRKQKWSLNPRGKWWSEDSSKFGQRMLEKMGWTKGKGLGVNEQGITEFSSASFKKDTSGVGYDKSVEAWTEQMDKFGEFLRQLNENEDSNLSGQSTELRSKQSNTHDKKCTHGIDTNKYMSKDLASTVGQNESVDKTQIKVEKDSNEKEVSDFRDDWYGVVTINGGNMVDYFKRKSNYKMSNYLKCNELNNDTNLSNNMTNNRTTDSESENDQHIGFGCTFKTENVPTSNYGELKNSDDKSNFAFDNPCLRLNSPTETVCNTNNSSAKSTKRKKKFNDSHINDKHNSRKKLKTETIDGDCKSGFVNPALNLDMNIEEDCNGKEFEVIRTQFGLENCGLDLTDERNDQKRVTFNDHVMLYEYNMNSSKKKKGEITLDKFEVENKKKNKKKRKCESTTTPATNGFVNEALDVQILYEEINDNELNEHKNKKIKKRKICKTFNLETIQESPEKEITEINIESVDTLDTCIVESGETDTVDQKSKRKKKKKEKEGKRIKVDDTAVFYVLNEEPDIVTEEIINKSKKIKKVKESKEEETISKKCKKERKKDKENDKSEKQINNDQQDIKTLKTLDEIESVASTKEEEEEKEKELGKTKQKKKKRKSINKEDCLNEINAIETLSISSIKEEEIEVKIEVKIKQKKKKRKSINKEDCPNEINVSNVEKEISDKENTDTEQDSNIKKLAKKDKRSKKSKDKNVSDIDFSNPNEEIVDINVIQRDKIENTECTNNTPSKKEKVNEAVDTIINSSWNVTARMSKKMLVTLFHNNAISEFPGSNIHNIKGYGTDDYEF